MTHRFGGVVRCPSRRGGVAPRAAPDVRPSRRRAAPGRPLHRERPASRTAAGAHARRIERALPRRVARRIRYGGAVLLPRRVRQRRLARRSVRPRRAHRHPRRDRLTGLAPDPAPAPARRWHFATVPPRFGRPARNGRLLPAHLGPRRAEGEGRRAANQYSIPADRRVVSRRVGDRRQAWNRMTAPR